MLTYLNEMPHLSDIPITDSFEVKGPIDQFNVVKMMLDYTNKPYQIRE